MRNTKTRCIVIAGMMSAMSVLLYFIAEIPIFPSIFPHLKIDLSDIPSLIAGIFCGPVYGVAVEFVKNIIHLMRTGTFGIGETANFIVGTALVVSFCLVYKKLEKKSQLKAIIIASIVSWVSIVVAGIIANAILYPIFMSLLGAPIESKEVFFIYLWSTVGINSIKTAVTVIPIIPLLAVLRKKEIKA